MDDPQDPAERLAMLTARLDQAAAETRMIANVIGSYYRNLVANGLPQDHALELARDYQDRWFDYGQPPEAEEA